FRYACRVSMCGSCGMVINGRERLACKTTVASLKGQEITIRPLNHFPVIKDLVVDMEPFFKKYEQAMPFFDPAHEQNEPAIIKPNSKERQAIGRVATECIACGCCVSSCTMMNYHQGYQGPAALNRAFTLLLDSRDGLYDSRIDHVLQSCYNCRTEFNCTEVCPKEISPTRAIKYIQRLALKEPFRRRAEDTAPAPAHYQKIHPAKEQADRNLQDLSRRRFLKSVTYGIGAATALFVGGVAVSSAVGPTLRKEPTQWVRIDKMEDISIGQVKTVNINYTEHKGFYTSKNKEPIMVWRKEDELVVYNSECPHLGCQIHWDQEKQLFLCACHGGTFDLDGSVVAGPPPRPMYRYNFKVEDGYLFAEV
ncbi:MAG: 2Fe-2S iron-sulfur cluster-binding protein, partial [Desulfovermiculus sp.]